MKEILATIDLDGESFEDLKWDEQRSQTPPPTPVKDGEPLWVTVVGTLLVGALFYLVLLLT